MKGILKVAIGLFIVFSFLLQFSCKNNSWKIDSNDAEMVHQGVQRLTEIIKFDIFSPPVASRIYMYATVAGYEGMRPGYEDYNTLSGILKDLPALPEPDSNLEYYFPLCGVSAMVYTGKALVFSESKVSDLEDELFLKFKDKGISDDIYERSLQYGKSVSEHILQWSKSDNYAQTRSLPKYTIRSGDPSRWVPTPPSYADALEPYWMTIRTCAVDSLTQFQVSEPIPFSTDKNSEFYKAAMEVLEVKQNLTKDQEKTAWYWDDNPYAVDARGHLMAARKKTSPGGHWMNIASAACKIKESDAMHSMSVLVKTSIALFDGFIMCWQEKFRTNVIRPETYINKYIDPAYQPMIETPPFPEHPSGHATISAAAAAYLTYEFGEPFTFVDSTEVEYGMEARKYTAFMEAAREAATSRLYGGIHYRKGNEAGTDLGVLIGSHVATKIQTRVQQ
jgi:hypothetical protein